MRINIQIDKISMALLKSKPKAKKVNSSKKDAKAERIPSRIAKTMKAVWVVRSKVPRS